jgi:hypothetical protein
LVICYVGHFHITTTMIFVFAIHVDKIHRSLCVGVYMVEDWMYVLMERRRMSVDWCIWGVSHLIYLFLAHAVQEAYCCSLEHKLGR